MSLISLDCSQFVPGEWKKERAQWRLEGVVLFAGETHFINFFWDIWVSKNPGKNATVNLKGRHRGGIAEKLCSENLEEILPSSATYCLKPAAPQQRWEGDRGSMV